MTVENSIIWLRQTAMLGALLIATTSSSEAAGIYTATFVGDVNSIQQTASGITNTKTGETFTFATPTLPTVSVTPSKLPSVTQINGATNGYEMAFPMRVYSENEAGTLLGVEPTGSSRAEPWSTTTYGYALKAPDGSYGPFTPLIPNDLLNSFGRVYMNNSNQIFFAGDTGMKLLDLNTGITTDIGQLITPALLTTSRYAYPDYISGIDDRGDLLVDLFPLANSEDTSDRLIILTPPGLAAPQATPEPSTIIAFAGLAGALGVRAVRRRGR